MSRIALRVSSRRCVLRFILYCVEVVALCRVSCFVQGEVFRCDVAMFRFVVVYCVSS